MTIKISIIIPCYNAALFISNTINAVKNQSFTNWECIIINDGSTDNSLEIIEKESFDSSFRIRVGIKEISISNKIASNLYIK